MRHAVVIALLAATPVAAQDSITAAAFLQTFQDQCATIAADPETAIAGAIASDTGGGAVSTDKAILQLTTVIDIPGTSFATLFYQRYILPADSAAYCTITASFDDPGTPVALPELVDLIATAAPTILGGPVTRHGSDVFADGQIARMYLWTAGDSILSDSITLNQTPSIVTLSAKSPAAD